MGFLDNTGLARVWGKIKTALGGKVDKTTTVNGHALSGNVSVTKGDVGLGNVNNTSDANKPISTATQTALNGKVSTSTTVNGHALSSNVSVTQQDIGIKYSSDPPSNPSDGDIWLQPESASNILHDTDIASSAITGKNTVNAALTQLNSDVSNLNGQKANQETLAKVCNDATAPAGGIDAGTFYYNNGLLYYAESSIAQGATVPPTGANPVPGLNSTPKIVSNVDGTAFKFPSGLMICTKQIGITTTITNPWGQFYESGSVSLGNWPAVFSEVPYVTVTALNLACFIEGVYSGTTTYCGSTYLLRPDRPETPKTYNLSIIGIGRWK